MEGREKAGIGNRESGIRNGLFITGENRVRVKNQE